MSYVIWPWLTSYHQHSTWYGIWYCILGHDIEISTFYEPHIFGWNASHWRCCGMGHNVKCLFMILCWKKIFQVWYCVVMMLLPTAWHCVLHHDVIGRLFSHVLTACNALHRNIVYCGNINAFYILYHNITRLCPILSSAVWRLVGGGMVQQGRLKHVALYSLQ